MHNTLSIIVALLDGGAFIRKLIVKYSLIVFLLHLYAGKLLFANAIIDIKIS